MFLKQQLILTKFNRPGNIKGVAGFKKQTEYNYTHTNVGAKVQPYEPSLLIVFATQMLKYLRFV